jgi:hypothetical protein
MDDFKSRAAKLVKDAKAAESAANVGQDAFTLASRRSRQTAKPATRSMTKNSRSALGTVRWRGKDQPVLLLVDGGVHS